MDQTDLTGEKKNARSAAMNDRQIEKLINEVKYIGLGNSSSRRGVSFGAIETLGMIIAKIECPILNNINLSLRRLADNHGRKLEEHEEYEMIPTTDDIF